MLSAGRAWADHVQWSNVNGGAFNVGANWIGGVVPGASDSARFGRTRDPSQQAAYTVSFNSSPSNVSLVVERDRVTLDLNGNAYLLTDPNFAMSVGLASNGSGRLTLIDGVVATTRPDSRVTIGADQGAPGFLTLSTGAQLLGASLHVGYAGNGSLVVQNGADIVGGPMFVGSEAVAGTTGTATVTGAGSAVVVEDLSVGWFGRGTLNINSGGRVESTIGTLGRNSGVLGTVNIDGASSRWVSSATLLIGYLGPGALNISGGARVQADDVSVGTLLGAVGAISVSGSAQLIVQSRCTVGNNSPGTMSVTGGSLVQSGSGDIGVIAPGTVDIQGAGSLWTCSSRMTIGAGTGNGSLNITGGGEVRSDDASIARVFGVGSVTVSGPGSLWAVATELSVGGDIATGHAGGTASVDIGPGGTVTTDDLYIFPQGSVELDGGTLDVQRIAHADGGSGDLTLLSGVLHAILIEFSFQNDGATLAPGHPTGHTSISGDYYQLPDATLEIEIGGPGGSNFDQVIVDGVTLLQGTLDVRLINGFVPSSTQTFRILRSFGIIGALRNVANGQRVATSDGSGSFLVHYGVNSPLDPTALILSDFRPCTADVNHDGQVDFFDYLDFAQAFADEDPSADFNEDGQVDFFDYLDFAAAFAAGC
jgi:T5SS/PEP-CTERM-associated repeat protein